MTTLSVAARRSAVRNIAHDIRRKSPSLRKRIREVFTNAMSQNSLEVPFINELISQLTVFCNTPLAPGVHATCRSGKIHQRPIVTSSTGRRCELGDVLVAVKYRVAGEMVGAKSIIYQVKMSQRAGSSSFDISPKQLDLLCDWPTFSFGKDAAGNPISFTIHPVTLEFGSYMLEMRGPLPPDTLVRGRCPYARLVRKLGPATVSSAAMPYAMCDTTTFFRHLAFEMGEPHDANPDTQKLVDALYRLVGLAPDPPDEFEGYWEPTQNGHGFAVIELTVEHGDDRRFQTKAHRK